MTAWLLSMALAQSSNAWLESDCEVANPIAGTAGYANARSAIRTNALTYSAGAFARRRMRGQVVAAWDMRAVFGVAMVPSYCGQFGARREGDVYLEPIDLHATNLGFNMPIFEDGPMNSKFRLLYASSVTSSTNWNRAGTFFNPMFNVYPAVLAPAIGVSSTGEGLGTYSVNWIGGALFRSDVISVQAGYTGQRGVYADVTQEKVALFVNGVLDRLSDGVQKGDLAYWMGGMQQLDWTRAEASEDVGMTSLFYRSLPQRERPASDDEDQQAPLDLLRTGHVRQEDISRRFDFSAAWQFGQNSSIRELSAAYHTDDWHVRANDRRTQRNVGFIRAGIIHLPEQPLLGVKGGVYPLLQFVYRETGDDIQIEIKVQLNDPDLLDLYPFAYNAVGVEVDLTWLLPD